MSPNGMCELESVYDVDRKVQTSPQSMNDANLKVQRKDEHRARLMIGPQPLLIISSTLPIPIGRGLEGRTKSGNLSPK